MIQGFFSASFQQPIQSAMCLLFEVFVLGRSVWEEVLLQAGQNNGNESSVQFPILPWHAYEFPS